MKAVYKLKLSNIRESRREDYMQQYKLILKRLLNPSIIISIVAQIASVLTLFQLNVDMNIVETVVTAICSILVLLGIVSNPDTMNKGYGDDIKFCTNCNKYCEYVMVAGKLICKECGCAFTPPNRHCV